MTCLGGHFFFTHSSCLVFCHFLNCSIHNFSTFCSPIITQAPHDLHLTLYSCHRRGRDCHLLSYQFVYPTPHIQRSIGPLFFFFFLSDHREEGKAIPLFSPIHGSDRGTHKRYTWYTHTNTHLAQPSFSVKYGRGRSYSAEVGCTSIGSAGQSGHSLFLYLSSSYPSFIIFFFISLICSSFAPLSRFISCPPNHFMSFSQIMLICSLRVFFIGIEV